MTFSLSCYCQSLEMYKQIKIWSLPSFKKGPNGGLVIEGKQSQARLLFEHASPGVIQSFGASVSQAQVNLDGSSYLSSRLTKKVYDIFLLLLFKHLDLSFICMIHGFMLNNMEMYFKEIFMKHIVRFCGEINSSHLKAYDITRKTKLKKNFFLHIY